MSEIDQREYIVMYALVLALKVRVSGNPSDVDKPDGWSLYFIE